ncbi:hypothetical protein HWV62_4119 [Athelia sp. TMB]|nr:hypothetical protein HWV62_4119 [Athelia sp. TMB]
MSYTGLIVGSIFGGLAIWGIVSTIAFLQLQHDDERRLNGRPKCLSLLWPGSHIDDEGNQSGFSTSRTSELELEAFAEAVYALEQAKKVIAGRCARLLAWPVDTLLDVVEACSLNALPGMKTNVEELGGIRKALLTLDGKTDSALVLLHQLVTSTQPTSQIEGPLDKEQLCGALGLLLENLSISIKRILAQSQSSIKTPRVDIIISIRSAVREFAALDRLCIQDIIALLPPDELVEGVKQLARDHRTVLYLRPPWQPDRSTSLNNLACAFKARFDQLGEMADLEQSIVCHRSTLELLTPGHPNRAGSLNNFACALKTRFDQSGQPADLEQAITSHYSALELCPPGHPCRYMSLTNLASALKSRFRQFGQLADLEQVIACHSEALELHLPGHPERSVSLNHLSIALFTRFNHLGRIADLDQAMTYQHSALELRPAGHPDRPISLNNLALSLYTRFNQLGQMADLEQSITYHRDALELHPPGHPDYIIFLDNLASALNARFDQTGQIADLGHAITYHCNVLELCPPGHPDRSTFLGNLAIALFTRFNQLGQMSDLDQVITYHRDALELRPPGHPDCSISLGSLAFALGTRFDHLGQMPDLEQAVTYHHSALELRPPGHPDRSMSLNNLGLALSARFGRLGQMADLEQAIIHHRSTLELHPQGHPCRSSSLGNLASTLKVRFDQLGQMIDLDQSIIYYNALELHSPGHPCRSISLCNLATTLNTRFHQLGKVADLKEAIQLLQLGSNDASDSPKHRYLCASRLIALLEEHNQPTLLEVYEIALSHLQLVLAMYPDVELRQEALGTDSLSPSLAMSAAACAIGQGQPDKAVELLEQGRSMLWADMRGYRQPVEAVRQVDATLADRFKTTSEQLEALATSSRLRSNKSSSESSGESRAVSEARWTRQRQLSSERDEIIQQIHQLDGLEHFLQAVPFNELQEVAAEGPVIIVNVALQRSDAIILHRRDAPIVIPLEVNGQDRTAAARVIRGLSELLFRERGKAGFSRMLSNTILKLLADILVTPVLEKLDALGVPEQSRIWWCPTSALCALPIHAAGQLPNKYISSYTPTLSALISARRSGNKPPPLNANDSKPSVLAIIHPGHPPKNTDEPDERLRTVFAERNVIEKAGGPGRIRSLSKAEATRTAVLDELPNHKWLHFACHGHLDISSPFGSAFELETDPLWLSDLVQARLPNADFAFLAACDSATSGGTSNTPDESLHLAAAVQFCGVRSVVGTLWPMADGDGPRVAQVFYRHMLKENDSRRSAEALQKVVMAMRKKTGPWAKANDEGEALQRWANYIHIGA